MPDRIQRNRTTGEYRMISDTGETRPYTQSAEPSAGPEMYHPGLTDSPFEAGAHELLRTGKEAAIGMVRSPWDLLKNTLGLVTSPVESMKGMAHAVSNPRETLQQLGDNPREAGSQLGQLLLGRYAVPALAPKVPGAVSALGRGAETLGTTLAESKIGGFGLPGLGIAEAVIGRDPMGAAAAVAPYALKYGGRGLQRAGAGLEGLKRGAAVAEEAEPAAAAPRVRASREAPYRAERSAPLEPPLEPELSVVEPTPPEAQVAPTAIDVEELLGQIPEEAPPPTLPTSWSPYLENPAMQGIRQALEEMRQRPTAGLTNPMGR